MSMGSKLNDAAKKNLELGFTVFSQGEKERVFPPESTKKYPIGISERALREYIQKGGEVLVIPVEGGKDKTKKEEEKEEVK